MMKEGALVRVPVVSGDVKVGPTGERWDTSYGIVLCAVSNRFGNMEGYEVWVFDTKCTAVYDEYWINPLT